MGPHHLQKRERLDLIDSHFVLSHLEACFASTPFRQSSLKLLMILSIITNLNPLHHSINSPPDVACMDFGALCHLASAPAVCFPRGMVLVDAQRLSSGKLVG